MMQSPDGLTTTNAAGRRVKIFPASPPKKGFFEVRRKWVQWGMILLYMVVPFISVNGHPLLLLDIAHRRFSIMGTLFFAHEVPNLVFVITSFLFGIALITTLLGRAWCGWACPQTVFIDRIFRKIENLIIGDHLKQRRLHESTMDFDKAFKLGLKWFAFVLVSITLGHFFLAYFVGAKPAFHYILEGPSEHWGSFFWVMLMSGVVLFDFAWFREQFCLVACPYGRFQSVMMDQGSLFLAYDEKRGDCINCMKCVKVCPTGIDVRHGLQFECIACTACADACDSVMEKIKKPKHLIGYGSILSLQGKIPKILRGRTIVYGTLLSISLFALQARLSARKLYQQDVIRAIDTPYQLVTDPSGRAFVINHFKIEFYNLDWNKAQVSYALSADAIQHGVEMIRAPSSQQAFDVESGKYVETQFFLKVPRTEFQDGIAKSSIEVNWNQGGLKSQSGVTLVGP